MVAEDAEADDADPLTASFPRAGNFGWSLVSAAALSALLFFQINARGCRRSNVRTKQWITTAYRSG
jgi:hypothetical protein